MGNDLNCPLHIEFYGLPGCGKSTISHRLAKNLRTIGYKVIEPSFDIDHVKGGILARRAYKIKMLVSLWLFHHSLYLQLVDIVKSNRYNGKDFVSQLINITQKIRIYNSKKQSDIVIWDQGLVQAAVSLSTNGYISSADNYIKLLSIIDKTVVFSVYMKCSIETALFRMEMRISNDSRVEKLSSLEEKKMMLHSIESCCNNVLNQPICIIDCNSASVDSIYDNLLNELNAFIKKGSIR